MKRTERQSWLLALILTCSISVNAFSQNVTGIWKGYFKSEDGQHYRLEFQVKQNADGSFSATGVSYSWQDDIRFYGKATMTGNFVKTSQSLRIQEIKTVELVNPGGLTCIMKYNLVYSKSGKEEFLEGTYLGKYEVKGRPNPYEWGDCGGGTVHLRKVETSDFYIEPFLRKKGTVTPLVKTNVPPSKDTTTKRTAPVVIKRPPVTNKTTAPVKKETATVKTTITRDSKKDTTVKNDPLPLVKTTVKPPVITPAVLKERQNELMKSLVVNDPDVTVKLYDNGEIDDDTISIFYDKKLLVSSKRLSATPIIVKLRMDNEDEIHELVMVAENLGRIPPNTSLMVVEAGDQRFDVRITSTEQKNALVRFRYQKPAQP
ncbi:MAG: hypothetical protein JNN00_11255 [Chitinophagaceae bacterium]|nr:hypothetical protein [Chitinophagaceae bacterium]